MGMMALKMENVRNRFSPHFVFNVLNIFISNLPKGVNVKPLRLLIQVLRANLLTCDQVAVSLEDELQMVMSYSALRHETNPLLPMPRFDIAKEVDMTLMLPSMILQIPVENALKHAFVGTEESTPIKASSLAELKDKINSDTKKVKHGTKITITATHTGEIAFPSDFMIHGEYSGLFKYVEKKTKIIGDKQVKTWDIAVLSDVEIQLRLSSTRQSSSREIYTDSTFLHSGVYDGDFNRIVTLQALYDTQGKIYAPLDDNAVVRHLAEKYKKVTINGKTADGKFFYNEADKQWYIELYKPSAYQNGRADGYDVDFAEGVKDYMSGDILL